MKQNNTVGIALMALGFFAFAATDALAKLLTENFHPLQIVWIRTSGLFLGVCVLIAMRGTSILVTPKRGLQIVRGLLAIGSATFFIVALKFVPLVDAVAVTFVAPFIVTIFGALLLKEPVGIRRWLAVIVGFMGMLIVIRPGFAVFHPAIFLVVIAAMFFASRQLVSRWLSGIDPIVTTIAYTSIVTFLLTSLSLPFIWRTPSDVNTLLVMLALAVLSAIGEVLIISALDMAQSVVLAPIHYTLILWSTLYGYFVFNELPDQWTLIGCSIIVVSGLYTIYREHRLNDKVKTA